jgi:hypothetical protein
MLPDTLPAPYEYTQCRARYHFTFLAAGYHALGQNRHALYGGSLRFLKHWKPWRKAGRVIRARLSVGRIVARRMIRARFCVPKPLNLNASCLTRSEAKAVIAIC